MTGGRWVWNLLDGSLRAAAVVGLLLFLALTLKLPQIGKVLPTWVGPLLILLLLAAIIVEGAYRESHKFEAEATREVELANDRLQAVSSAPVDASHETKLREIATSLHTALKQGGIPPLPDTFTAMYFAAHFPAANGPLAAAHIALKSSQVAWNEFGELAQAEAARWSQSAGWRSQEVSQQVDRSLGGILSGDEIRTIKTDGPLVTWMNVVVFSATTAEDAQGAASELRDWLRELADSQPAERRREAVTRVKSAAQRAVTALDPIVHGQTIYKAEGCSVCFPEGAKHADDI